MESDHYVLSRARNSLADALKTLLKAELMDAGDFRMAHFFTSAALEDLDALLCQPHRDEAQPENDAGARLGPLGLPGR